MNAPFASPGPSPGSARLWLALATTTAPSLLAYNPSPSPTFLNQALAFVLWGAFVAAVRPGLVLRQPAPLLAALGLVAAAAAWSWGPGGLPAPLALSAIGTLLAAAVVAAGGAGARARGDGAEVFAAVAWGLLLAGVLNVLIAALQVFAPGLLGSDWIASSSFPGRAVGNLRQPNHLSSLLLWACIATVALVQMGRLPRRAGAVLGTAFVVAVVLTASRTGLVSVVLLAVWGLLDRRLARPVRLALLLAPWVYALAWLALAQWATLTEHSFGGSARLAETDISSSRFAIWANTLELIRQQPWTGVGFGEFNFAWTLTPFPGRPVALFDHTHNLPLQLAVELGLPLATLVLGALVWALWRAARAAWRTEGELGDAQRCAVLMVLMIGLHSLLEYPLWYAYFLLPAAWLWGFALGAGPASTADGALREAAPPRASAAVSAAALAVVAGALLAVLDYRRVAAVFSADDAATPLAQRIATGQRSWLFAHHADYAAVTSGVAGNGTDAAFARATHYLLDTRLMLAWARHHAAQGDEDGARHLAARLREFRNPGARSFFAACEGGQTAAGNDDDEDSTAPPAPPAAGASASTSLVPPFQCQPPVRERDWRSFLPR